MISILSNTAAGYIFNTACMWQASRARQKVTVKSALNTEHTWGCIYISPRLALWPNTYTGILNIQPLSLDYQTGKDYYTLQYIWSQPFYEVVLQAACTQSRCWTSPSHNGLQFPWSLFTDFITTFKPILQHIFLFNYSSLGLFYEEHWGCKMIELHVLPVKKP